jgi:hypothetical protein
MYGKLVDNKLAYAPTNFFTPNGRLILNFSKNENLMKEFGFKLVVEDIPSYNPNKYDLYVYEYVETDDSIIIIYKTQAKKKVVDFELTSIKNRLYELEHQNEIYQTILSEEANK